VTFSPAQRKRLRGVILKLVQQRHAKQKHRHYDWSLMDVLNTLHFNVYLNLVRELVQDLVERGCLAAKQDKDKITGEVSISEIEIRPHGRDILEGTATDEGIMVEVELD